MHTAKNKKEYLIVELRPFFLGRVFPRKLPPHQLPFGSGLTLTLTT